MDRFDLYELCTQNPALDVALLRAIHGGAPRVLGEDFAGTAALSREWVRVVRGGRAIAVDRDPEPLARARARARDAIRSKAADRSNGVECVVADVRRVARKVDLLVALNFSWCMLHERRELVAYLKRARRRLTRGGCFVADLYGGDGAFMQGKLRETRRGPDGEKIVYEFEQREADALTGRVVDALHFEVTPRRGKRVRMRDAFVYDWRLWSIPELRDALCDAGFASSEVHSRFEHARSGGARGGRGERVHVRPLTSSQELGASWCVFVVARSGA